LGAEYNKLRFPKQPFREERRDAAARPGAVMAAGRQGSTASERPRIRVENVEMGEYAGRSLDEALAHTIAEVILKVDLENLRCPERAECSKRASYLSIGCRFRRAGYRAEQVDVSSTARELAPSVPEAEVVVRIEKTMERLSVNRTITRVGMSFTIVVKYLVTDKRTGRSADFTTSCDFGPYVDILSREEVERERPRVARDLFDKEEGIVLQVAEWVERKPPQQ
jgi:hypothetical protein